MELGMAIRSRRKAGEQSLQSLADQAGISRAMLSDIERGAKNPTIKVVCQIAEALHCSVSDLLNEPGSAAPEVSVLRAGAGRHLVDPQTGIQRSLLAPSFVARGLEVVWYEVPPGQDTGIFPAHPPGTAEHLTLVAGRLECYVGPELMILEAGDSLTFRADVPHRFINRDASPAAYFLVIAAPRA
ncbi:MAG TPA: XRE family transcriptional regulator [Chloroflexia bacterium]|nr:XRE family transcriptional regulator [Chloroflexia bacterium]